MDLLINSSSTSGTHHRSHPQHKLSDFNVGHKLLQKMGTKTEKLS